ncbi:CE192 protein, partial [Turnix velox]|nr:CE192 protein [Turnix velox]
MEDFRNIGDETFPSFLGHSLNSDASAVFENVTISSHPGLPVAASTVARSKAGCANRHSDICASYLEGKNSPCNTKSHPEQMGKCALNLCDDLRVATQVKELQKTSVNLKESHSICREQDENAIGHPKCSQDTLLEVLPLERLEDLSTGMCVLPDSKHIKVGPSEPTEKLIGGEISSDHLSNSLSSFLENEKLSSLLNSEEDSTDDDIDDEEFFDNRLEAYFEQLMQPEMTREDTDIQKLSECYMALKFSENGFFQV